MVAKSRRRITITYSNDVEGEQELNAATNTASPAMIQPVTLTGGNNTIDVPAGATCCTIVKDSENTTAVRLCAADDSIVGVQLHNTDPDSITVGGQAALFIFLGDFDDEVPAADVDIRLFWS